MEKEKHKRGSYRRYNLLFLVMLVCLIVGLAVFIGNLLRPRGPYIIYLAPDENGVTALWKADLANLEHPQQLTDYEDPNTRINHYQITDDGRYIAYFLWNWEAKIILLDIQKGVQHELVSCVKNEAPCYGLTLRPDGRYLAYWQDTPEEINVHVIDLETFSDAIIHQFNTSNPQNRQHNVRPSWVGEVGLLTFNLPGESYEFQIFDIEQNAAVNTLPLGTESRRPIFSPDGSRYAYYQSGIEKFPEIIAIRETENPENPINVYREQEDNVLTSQRWTGNSIFDWHPDNEQLLIGEGYWANSPSSYPNQIIYNLQLFDTTNGSIERLTEENSYSYFNATFNHNGSQILYQRTDVPRKCDRFCSQIMIYDMEIGEHTTLPLWGELPKWVNGGEG